MRPLLLTAMLVALGQLFGFLAAAQDEKVAPPASKAQVIFAVSRAWDKDANTPRGSRPFIDAVALVENGRYLPPPRPPDNKQRTAKETTRFEEQYFASGKQYAVYVGGDHAGTVEVIRPEPLSCASLSAVVRGTGALEDDDVRAVATSLPIPPRTPATPRRPTAEEEAAVVQLAGSTFRLHGARSSSLHRIRIERLIVTDLDRDQQPELVGNFSLIDKGERTLLLVAGSGEGSFKAELAWHYLSSEAPDDRQRRSLVDHLDLDGDGVDELIVRLEGYEDWKYGIYKKDKKHWRLIYTGGGGGC